MLHLQSPDRKHQLFLSASGRHKATSWDPQEDSTIVVAFSIVQCYDPNSHRFESNVSWPLLQRLATECQSSFNGLHWPFPFQNQVEVRFTNQWRILADILDEHVIRGHRHGG